MTLIPKAILVWLARVLSGVGIPKGWENISQDEAELSLFLRGWQPGSDPAEFLKKKMDGGHITLLRLDLDLAQKLISAGLDMLQGYDLEATDLAMSALVPEYRDHWLD